eukprot:780623-Prymnesium_polylepis.1
MAVECYLPRPRGLLPHSRPQVGSLGMVLATQKKWRDALPLLKHAQAPDVDTTQTPCAPAGPPPPL